MLNHKKLIFAPLLAASLLFNGCTDTEKDATTTESPSPAAELSPAESPAAEESPVAESPAETEAGAEEVDLLAIIGTKADGWMPKALADYKLKEDMTPEEAGKEISGAEEISDFGFSEVKVEDVPGVKQYKFYFAKDDGGKPTQLKSVTLIFDPALKSRVSFEEMAKALGEKYGEVEPEKIEKGIVTWSGPGFSLAQLTKGLNDFEGYELKVDVPEG